MYLKFVHLKVNHLLRVFTRDYISVLSVHKIGSLEKPDLGALTCVFTDIQKYFSCNLSL